MGQAGCWSNHLPQLSSGGFMPLYDITDHPLLSPAVQNLGPETLAAHTEVAEALLRLSELAVFAAATTEYTQATNALALQVNFQVESGLDAYILQSLTRGARSQTFRGGKRHLTVHPQAARIMRLLNPVADPVHPQ
jgi:hypothetical protein